MLRCLIEQLGRTKRHVMLLLSSWSIYLLVRENVTFSLYELATKARLARPV